MVFEGVVAASTIVNKIYETVSRNHGKLNRARKV